MCELRKIILISVPVLLLFLLKSCQAQVEEPYAISCVDTKPVADCQFMRDNDWCRVDMKHLKRKCDYTCGWCSEDDDCIDAAKYLKCSEITQKECETTPEFYSTRCRKSCNWCNGLPDGFWKEWSQWSLCSSSCNEGFQIRSRRCLTRNCLGESSEVRVCKLKPCPHWSKWEGWSECSATCGKGVKTRTRTCPEGEECHGLQKEVTACELPPCSVGGITFNKWTKCSRTCGGGSRYKVKFCPARDVSLCPKEYQDCNMHSCPFKNCKKYRYDMDDSACCSDTDGEVCVRSTQRILNGRISKPKQFGWMARIEVVGGLLGSHRRRLLCGGTLIHPEFVLTAAHCLEEVTADRLQVLLGAISKDDTATIVQRKLVADFVIHPNYSEPENDIAIIRLQSLAAETGFVSKLCMPEGEETPVDTKCFVAGWGKISSFDTRGSDNLLEAKVRHLPFDVCRQGHRATPYGPHLNEKEMMCAGYIGGGTDICKGDSGGPLMCQRCSSCEWYLAGVTSFGSSFCGAAYVPGVYMRMTHYEDWVVEYVEQFYKFGMVCDRSFVALIKLISLDI